MDVFPRVCLIGFLLVGVSSLLQAEETHRLVPIGGPCTHSVTIPLDAVDHSRFDQLLKQFVDTKGQVCYSSWSNDSQAMQSLAQYLHDLGHADFSVPASRAAYLALGINAYNALAIWGILREYPVASIQLLNRDDGDYKIFDDVKVWLGNAYVSLNQIENEILRPVGDPRIHFALVCAARGCPRLRNEAYWPTSVDQQLTDNAIHFFSNSARFQISKFTGKVRISPILKWYGEDFGDHPDQLMATIFQWLPLEDREWLATHLGWKLDYLGYDWGLNDQCPTFSVAASRIPFEIAERGEPLIRPLLPDKK